MMFYFQVKYLSLFGGGNVKDTVGRVMKEIMTCDLARQYNFLGQKGKFPFGTLRLASAVYSKLLKLLLFIFIEPDLAVTCILQMEGTSFFVSSCQTGALVN